MSRFAWVLPISLIAALVLTGCDRDKPVRVAATPEPVTVRSDYQRAYDLLDALMLAPNTIELPPGFSRPGPYSGPADTVELIHDSASVICSTVQGPDSRNWYCYRAFTSQAGAQTYHDTLPLTAFTWKEAFAPPSNIPSAKCATGTFTPTGEGFSACLALVGNTQVGGFSSATPGGARGNDESAASLLSAAVVHLERLQAGSPLLSGAVLPAKVVRVGWLAHNPYMFGRGLREIFQKQMEQLGYHTGKNLVYEYGFANDQGDRIPALAAAIVAAKPDVIITRGHAATRAAKQLTSTIPIVLIEGTDPVSDGLVSSYARPGGNVTGFASPPLLDLAAKQVDLLKQALPHVTRLAVITGSTQSDRWRVIQTTAAALGIQAEPVIPQSASDVDEMIDAAAAAGIDAIYNFDSAIGSREWSRVRTAALRHRLPLIVTSRTDYAIFTYGPDPADHYERGAEYVDKLLKGTHPSDLPVEFPKRYELRVYLRQVQAIGLTLSPSFLALATAVIE